jgi:raffinose/stachyose/melibiose transport system permease protein
MRSSKITPFLFIGPALIYLGVFMFYPIASNAYLSFLSAPTPRSRDYFYVGLQNFVNLFQDNLFLTSLLHNIVWVLLSILIPVVIGLIVAVLLSGRRRTRLFYAGVFFIPQTIAAVIAAIVWRWIYDPNVGPINQVLQVVGLASLKQLWLADDNLVLVCMNMVGSWTYVGFCVLMFMTGLQNISPQLYEAAIMDGTNPLQKFWYITLPLLRNTTLFVIVYTVIGSMKFFDLIFVATKGGPGQASYVVGLYIYNMLIQQGRINYASTMSTVLTVIILLLSIVLIRNIISEREA